MIPARWIASRTSRSPSVSGDSATYSINSGNCRSASSASCRAPVMCGTSICMDGPSASDNSVASFNTCTGTRAHTGSSVGSVGAGRCSYQLQ